MIEAPNLQISQKARIRRRPPVLSTEVEGVVVMMDMENGLYFGLDEIGTDIWQRLEAPMTVGELVAGLSQSYAADNNIIERDVLALLLNMAKHGLVDID
ncbi:PqqD family protein [Ferrovibrio sp.]|uniref:PqqD family protein n=1 Tax=Ferrovibrio sp. TaxID=1917215 RepID=UPI003D0A2F15